jgi:hypothetical protein
MLLRELRGGSHLVAVLASGVAPRVAHYFRRPARFASFGYNEDEIPQIGRQERDAMATCDVITDWLMATAYRKLSNEARDELAEGVNRLAAQVQLAD